MPINDDVADAAIRHQVFLLRFGGTAARRIVRMLDDAAKDLETLIASRIEKLPKAARDAAAQPSVARLQAILADVRAQSRDLRDALATAFRRDLVDLANVEVEIGSRQIDDAVGVTLNNFRPSPEVLRSLAERGPRAKRMRDWFTTLTGARADRIDSALKLGLIEGQTTPQIVRRVLETENVTRRAATTLVRTHVNHVANAAKGELYRLNDDVVSGLRWTATLDGRTSEICMARDGKIYPIGTGPRPPAHPNCRSVMVPVLRSWDDLAGRPLKPGRGGRDFDKLFRERLEARGVKNPDRVVRNTRASMDGQVPAETTYNAWLKRQPTGFQTEVLGPTKAALFRDGGLSVDRFVDENAGRPLTIEELRAREPEAWRRAGLD